VIHIWQQSWFLISVVLVLIAGVAAGLNGDRSAAEGFLRVVRPNFTTTVVLFLMAYSLDATRLRDALRRPAGAVWGSLVNLGLLPLVASFCSRIVSPDDFAYGLVIAAVSPCTLATASVFTRRAGGNDAISLLVTLLTNIACVMITPVWLRTLLSKDAALDLANVVQQLVVCVLLPTIVGQLCLVLPVARTLADRNRKQIGFVSQLIVLLIVSLAAVHAGLELRRQSVWPGWADFLVMALMCSAVHGCGLVIGWYGGACWPLSPEDRIATAIAGSQKTLPVGLLMVTNPSVVPPGMPFVAFPLLMYHAIQLVVDTAIADAWRIKRKPRDCHPWVS